MANVTEIPPPQTTETDDSTYDSTPEQTTSASKPARNGKHMGGRPPRSQVGQPKQKPEGKAPVFFKGVENIPAEDWGTRAFMYLYIDEPVCIAKTWGETRYAKKFHAPIFDLEPLKEMYGSFKGWLSLNIRKTGKDATDQTDRLDFEIFDPLAPPKIPRKAWANDDRNRRWEALLPPEPPVKSDSTSTLRDAMSVIRDIKNDIKEEMEPESEPTNSTRETLETMKLAKELFAPAPAAEPVKPADPFDTAKKIMEMRANDPMVAALMSRLEAMDKAQEAARQREYDLQKELRQKESVPQKGLVDQILELANVAEKLGPLKALFGSANGTAEANYRPGKKNTYDFLSEVLPRIFESPLANAAAQKIMASTGPAMNPAIQPQATRPAPQADNLMQFIETVVTPSMLGYFADEATGEDFADWLYSGFPAEFKRLQNFTHPMLPGLVAPDSIIMAYKNTPNVWQKIAAQEARFVEFVKEFCNWKPEQEPATDVEFRTLDTEEPKAS